MTTDITAGAIDHPGMIRRLSRLMDDDGHIRVLAIDHLAQDFDVLLAPEAQDHAGVAATKAKVIAALANDVTGVLIDPPMAGALLASGAIPKSLGLVTAAEEESYTFPDGPRSSRMREGWGVDETAALDADMLKFLWFYRPDLDADVAAAQRELLTALAAECTAAAIPLIVEPIWFAIAGEDPSSPEWRAARHQGVVDSARAAADCGAHLLKVEFPGDATTAEGRAEAARLCAQIDATGRPWVLLSAGVSADEFELQLETACGAGCVGYMAGRSVWRSAIDAAAGANFATEIETSRERLRRLNAIVATGRDADTPLLPQDAAVEAFPASWYR